jgi:hypothetical protein
MTGGGTAYLICVLIDSAEVDMFVLEAVDTHVAPIAIARPVLDKVDPLDENRATALELDAVDPDLAGATPSALHASANAHVPGSKLHAVGDRKSDAHVFVLTFRRPFICVHVVSIRAIARELKVGASTVHRALRDPEGDADTDAA